MSEKQRAPRLLPPEELAKTRAVPNHDADPTMRKLVHRSRKVIRTTYSQDPEYPGYERFCTVTKEDLSTEEVTASTADNKRLLGAYRLLARDVGETLANLMSGDTPENLSTRYAYSAPKDVRSNHYKNPGSGDILTFGQVFYTGRDLGWLKNNFPHARFKFYISFDLSTPEKKTAADDFIRKLLVQCVAQKISLTTKSFDHDYDSYNLYTYDREAMADVLQQLYPKYVGTGIFLDTTRYFQAPIDDISPDHIAWVQEPPDGVRGHSHSTRMGVLGRLIEGGKTYEEACTEIGVKPEAPWLAA